MSGELLEWYSSNKRDLPFRDIRDPYKVWLSEVILQQTRVEQGLDYYNRFVRAYPTVEALAGASSDDVMRMWQGLGYYSRARNLLKAARDIVEKYAGEFPGSYKELLSLSGVGEYTAAAIASIAFGEPVAVVDGNVFRVLSRVFCIEKPIDTSQGRKIIKELANSVLDKNNPGKHNEAIMELGALVCKPKSPECYKCPLASRCEAFKKQVQSFFPVKQKKQSQKHRYLYFVIITSGGDTFIHKRTEADIWRNLYQFPLYESLHKLSEEEIFNLQFIKNLTGAGTVEIKKISQDIKHVLSHQILNARFIHINVPEPYELKSGNIFKINWEGLSQKAMPRLITRYLDEIAGKQVP